MKKWQNWFDNLSAEQLLWLVTVGLSAMLGTLASSLVLRWGLTSYGDAGVFARLAICVGATIAYAAAGLFIFFLIYPEKRVALKRIIVDKQKR